MARLPAVNVCLVAEQIRPEAGGKSTILGYAGVSPYVEFTIESDQATVPLTVAFFVVCEPAREDGPPNLEMELVGPDGVLIPKNFVDALPNVVTGKRYQCALNFVGVPVTRAGVYQLTLNSEKQPHSIHSFYVKRGVKDARDVGGS